MDDEPSVLAEIISGGENQYVEFKATLRYDIDEKKVNRDLTKVVAKTLAGFLNTHGGTLVIGVEDTGRVIGIAPDLITLSKPNQDGFELTLRTAISNYLGVSVGPVISLQFVELDGHLVASVACMRHHGPVFFRDGERQEFYIRDGNQTKPLDVRTTHEYIRANWPPELEAVTEAIRTIVVEALREELSIRVSSRAPDAPTSRPESPDVAEIVAGSDGAHELVRQAIAEAGVTSVDARFASEAPPPWMRFATQRVIDLFLRSLSGSREWKRLFIISPWLSAFDAPASLSFAQVLERLVRDDATAYVVTRPPEEDWHADAIERLGLCRRANVVLMPDLHVKLYTAVTAEGAFAMLGSANFTSKSFENREIGLLVDSYAEGKRVVARLQREASEMYRLHGRVLVHKATFALNA